MKRKTKQPRWPWCETCQMHVREIGGKGHVHSTLVLVAPNIERDEDGMPTRILL